jgi:D-alanine-D-alanine ligase
VRIGITFDLVPADGDVDGPDDRYEEFDKPETVEAIAAVLRGEGHEVVLLGDGRDFLGRVLADPPDFVWNNAEGEGIGRSREARVPAVLEMLGIPYSGSDPLTMAAALDKGVARRLVQAEGVPVPRGAVLAAEATPAEGCGAFRGLRGAYPLILKPAFEGSSKGIRARCLAETEADAVAVHRRLARDYRQPILVEEFIEGAEVTVGLVGGGDRVEVIGAMRVGPKVPDGRFVYSLEMKRNWREAVEYEAPARLPEGVMGRLILSARAAYEALGCRDVARIDFRVRDGIPYFIEANPLPGLAPGWSDLVLLARGHDIGHAELIRRILREALGRVGLAAPGAIAP